MANPNYWPLATSPFTLWDKLKISWWIISQDRYTMGEKVAELEEKFSRLSGAHALMVSNGSVANHLVFELWKYKNPGVKPVVIVPAVTWSSSVTPAMMAGMDVAFCDINRVDFSFDIECLKRVLQEQSDAGRHVIVWPTALIGWSPNMQLLRHLASQYSADLFLDACENTLANVYDDSSMTRSILSSAEMVTTSTFLSHFVCSVEGGFVFFKNRSDYELGKMFRNHGMSRSFAPEHPLRKRLEAENPTIDPQFLFAIPGTNWRASDVHAAFGLADFERIDAMKRHRLDIYSRFKNTLDAQKYYLPPKSAFHVPFCLPIFRNDCKLSLVKEELKKNGIESRPIIGSNLLLQPAFRHLGKPENFPTAQWIHTHGCYVGLHHKVTEEMVDKLTDTLNTL